MTRPQIRILIVEDDLVDRLACRRALAQNPDYEFVLFEAETGREGLQLAHAQKPDCVLLDYHLPDLNGLEFLTALRNDLGEISVPILMLTGADNVSVAVEAMRRGAQDYLVKDVNRQYLELLPTVIQRVLHERRMLTEKKWTEAKYRSLVEQIPAVAYIAALDVPGTLLYISPQIRQLGFSPEEWLADPEGLLKQIHPEDRMFVREEIARGYESGESLRCEYRMLTRAGEVRWFLNEAKLVHDESGEPLFLQGILVDITVDKQVEEELLLHRRRLEELVAKRTAQLEKQAAVLKSANASLNSELGARARAENALKQYADQLADLYNNAPCGYHSLDADGVFVQINDTELQWLGLIREEVVGKIRFADLLTPASNKIFQEIYPHFKERGWAHDLEFEIARTDGTSLFVLLNATAIKDTAGHFIMSRSTMFDITDRKRAEQALHVSEGRFRLLLESAGEGIYGLDTAGRCTFVNDAALKMLGYTRDEILGQSIHEFIHHTHADGSPYAAEECPIYDAFRTGALIRRHTELLWPKDGRSFPAEYSSYPIREGEHISGAVLVFRDITQEHTLIQQLTHQASHDTLTGLANRRDFEQRLERALAHAHTNGSEHTLCYLDLDHFKVINDTCGHAAGDQLLRQLSAILQEQTRSRDTLARLGGDEFGLLLEHCPLDQARRIVEELLHTVQQFKFTWEGKVHSIGVSIGVIPITAASDSLSAVLRAADAACYTAKRKGRNRVYVYQAGETELAQSSNETQWGARITQALETGRFALLCQPITALVPHAKERAQYEILVRMLNPDGQVITPEMFMPAAERLNLMPAIDRWVVRQVISWLATLPSESGPIYSINLSGASLADNTLLDFIREQLILNQIPGHMLGFEIAEMTAIDNLAQATHFFREIKKLGCQTTLDNFGSTMSSIACLKVLQVDYLKINGTFVKDIVQDRISQTLVIAINQAAHEMATKTIAGWTENPDILSTLENIGVDYVQGYAIARPRPLAELEAA